MNTFTPDTFGKRRTSEQVLIFGLCIGTIGALTTVMAGLAIHPFVAIALPILVCGVCFLICRPDIGALSLVSFAYLDGISDKLFAASPISGFKLITMLTVLGILLTAHQKRAHIRQVLAHPTILWGIGFIVAWMLAILLADSRSQAVDWGFRLINIAAILFILTIALDTEKVVKIAIIIVACASAISAVFVVIDTMLGVTLVSTSEAATTARTAEGFDRSSGASQANPTAAASMLLCGTVLALVLAIESAKMRRFMGVCAIIGTLGVVLSFARSAALVYFIIIIALSVRYGRFRMFAPFAVLALIGAFAMIPFIPPSYFERLASIFGGGGDWTLGRRLTYIRIGIDLAFKYPITGIGPGNFYLFFTDPEYRYLPGRTLFGRQLHNMYLSVLVEYGIIGFTFFMGVILSSLKLLKQVAQNPATDDLRAMAVAMLYAMVAFYLTSNFMPNEYIKYTWMLPALCIGLSLANSRALAKGGEQ